MFNRLCPPNFGRKKLAIFAKNIAQGKNVTQNFGNRWASSNMQATVSRSMLLDPQYQHFNFKAFLLFIKNMQWVHIRCCFLLI